MGLFDRVRTSAAGIGSSLMKGAGQVAGKATVEAKESAKIAATKADIAAVQAEIDTAYTAIGRAYVETAIAGKEICDIGCASTLKALEPKLERMQELQKELIALEKALDESQILQERQLIQAEIDEAKAKLDKAKAMGVISEEDYNAKLAHEMKKLDCYQELRNLKKQKEMGIISEAEMQAKVKAILG